MSQSILITGAGRGIGRSTAILAGRRGWSVGVNYANDDEAAARTVTAVEEAGGRALALQGDVAEEAEVFALFDTMRDTYGTLNGVVINAGIVAPTSVLADMAAERLRRMIDVNVYGALLCAREAARHLSTARNGSGGSIVFVSSMAAKLGAAFEYVDYAATKGAIDSLTIGMSRELGKEGVRVNAVRPGLIETDIHAVSDTPDRANVLGAQSPVGRPGRPEEVAEAILWLLSDAASYVTGAILDISGGR